MRITIPRPLARAGTLVTDWFNVPIGHVYRFELVRLDVILAAGLGVCAGWYYVYGGGWVGAFVGVCVYVFSAMAAIVARAANEQ
jgi:hypothetical protein